MTFFRFSAVLALTMPVAFATLAIDPQAARAASLEGSWSGGGYVKPKSGNRERVRCRVSFSRQGAKVYAVSATCASASTTIRQTGQLSMVNANRFVGDFHNSQYDISGRVRVTVHGGRLNVTFSSASGGGAMTLSRR